MKLIEDFPQIATTVAELTRISGLSVEYEILSNSERQIEHSDTQYWNNDENHLFTIYLKITIELYSKYEAKLENIEDNIKERFRPLLRTYPSSSIDKVIITPRLLTDENAKINLQAPHEKYAFISYQVKDKMVASSIKQLLDGVGIRAFLAHEDIEVSRDWQNRILEEMAHASIFVCLISTNYLASSWCLQEAGMAILKGITIIPLSLDGTIPNGFLSRYQAPRINPNRPRVNDLIPGLLNHNKFDGLSVIIELIGASGSYRDAEARFQLLLPYEDHLTEVQVRTLFQKIIANNQVHHAGLCASEYIPPLLKKYKNLLSQEDFEFLKNICAQYEEN